MEEKMEKLKKFSVILLIIIMSGFIFFYQTKKLDFTKMKDTHYVALLIQIMA